MQRGAAATTDLDGGRASARHALLAAHGEIGEGERGSGMVCCFQRVRGGFYSAGAGVSWTGRTAVSMAHRRSLGSDSRQWCTRRGAARSSGVRARSRRRWPSRACRGAASWANLAGRHSFSPRRATGDSGVKARGEALLCVQRPQRHGSEGEREQGGPGGPEIGGDDHGDGDTHAHIELGEVDEDGFAENPLAPVRCFFSFFFLLITF